MSTYRIRIYANSFDFGFGDNSPQFHIILSYISLTRKLQFLSGQQKSQVKPASAVPHFMPCPSSVPQLPQCQDLEQEIPVSTRRASSLTGYNLMSGLCLQEISINYSQLFKHDNRLFLKNLL